MGATVWGQTDELCPPAVPPVCDPVQQSATVFSCHPVVEFEETAVQPEDLLGAPNSSEPPSTRLDLASASGDEWEAVGGNLAASLPFAGMPLRRTFPSLRGSEHAGACPFVWPSSLLDA
mmetsp:Transcript_24577/g.48233  ORF Transcript_24577/g.48233 Transcript_24577/m.48233 type:complete len:119 (-) Transcript_24577:173-529(-)